MLKRVVTITNGYTYNKQSGCQTVPGDLPDWMMPVDDRILELLERTRAAKVGGLWVKGATVAVNLDLSANYVNKRLRKLEKEGYVERRDRPKGYYRITEKGSEFVRSD